MFLMELNKDNICNVDSLRLLQSPLPLPMPRAMLWKNTQHVIDDPGLIKMQSRLWTQCMQLFPAQSAESFLFASKSAVFWRFATIDVVLDNGNKKCRTKQKYMLYWKPETETERERAGDRDPARESARVSQREWAKESNREPQRFSLVSGSLWLADRLILACCPAHSDSLWLAVLLTLALSG